MPDDNKAIRRGLVLITKTIQSLANSARSVNGGQIKGLSDQAVPVYKSAMLNFFETVIVRANSIQAYASPQHIETLTARSG
jgi:hypothetical protein